MFFQQSRTVCCIIYNLEDLQQFIDRFGFADCEYAYIYHDKDKKEDGTLKPPHYHFYGHRKSPITEQSLENFAKKCKENIFYENLKSNDGALLRYFMHVENNDKAKYNIADIVSNFDVENRLSSSSNKIVIDPATIIAMYDGGFNTLDIVRKFPKLIYSIASLQRFERLVKNERLTKVVEQCKNVKQQQVELTMLDIGLFPLENDDNLPF